MSVAMVNNDSNDLKSAEAVVDFALKAGKLKMTMRKGWILRNVTKFTQAEETSDKSKPRIESVADHSWRIGLLATLLADEKLDKGRMSQMALVHDIAESITGDFTPVCGVSKSEKEKLEKDALTKITSSLSESNVIAKLWKEYEERDSLEAKTVKDLDLIEMALQAFEYEMVYSRIDLEEFFKSIEGKIRHEEVRNWEKALRARREKFRLSFKN